MQIVSPLVRAVDTLFDHLPTVDDARPLACPLCGKVAHAPGEERVGLGKTPVRG